MHEQERHACQSEAAPEEEPDRQSLGEGTGQRRGDERDHAQRQEAQAGAERRDTEHVLQVERQIEEHREHPRGYREGDEHAAREGRDPEQRQLEHRVLLRALE